ncbi:MAG: archaeal flagellar protein F [Euryarchaeota archaeon]|nr:archaeal flagellar protein F [Euryarchaeota archaeon]
MGLSVVATYGILFTASLFMLGMLLNGLLYSYDQFKTGVDNKISIIEDKNNLIKIERVVLNGTDLEIYALNRGPNTLNASKISLVINGTPVNFTCTHTVWFPGEENVLSTPVMYDLGAVHTLQFSAFLNDLPIASAEYDKIYALNSSGVYAYYYSGTLAWSRKITEPRDISVSPTALYVLTAAGIYVMDLDGRITSFLSGYSFLAIASRGSTIYAVNSTTLSIINTTTGTVTNVGIYGGKDVAVGTYVFVLTGNSINYYTYTGAYVGTIIGTPLLSPEKIAADPMLTGDYLLVLNGDGNVLVYKNEAYTATIVPNSPVFNIDLHGKIYMSGQSVFAYDGGYRIKMVDSYGNQLYTYL